MFLSCTHLRRSLVASARKTNHCGFLIQEKWRNPIHPIKLSVLFLKKKNHQKNSSSTNHTDTVVDSITFLFWRCKDENQTRRARNGERARTHHSHSEWHEWLYRREITRVKLDLWSIEMGELLGPRWRWKFIYVCVYLWQFRRFAQWKFGHSARLAVLFLKWLFKKIERLKCAPICGVSAHTHALIRLTLGKVSRLSRFLVCLSIFPRQMNFAHTLMPLVASYFPNTDTVRSFRLFSFRFVCEWFLCVLACTFSCDSFVYGDECVKNTNIYSFRCFAFMRVWLWCLCSF